jgi:EpsI family protein
MRLPGSKAAVVLTAVLAAQGAVYYAIAARPELTPAVAPLDRFPVTLPGWLMARNVPVEKEVADVLRASDTLNRIYADPAGRGVIFFIAYFQTQRTGATPHSPKNCLPGSGWEPVESPGRQRIQVPGRAEPLEVNRYVVAKENDHDVVLYWYQSHNRVIAGEFGAKFWLVADAVRYRRSDTALVKVVAPAPNADVAGATDAAISFVQAAYPAIMRQLPQ